ncbi:hypothetical protein GWI33_014190 [Rhynchophorus ferrugineus]|uniref:CHK kinase-like domain-containing protein n=1 Tax=Rhynchophorus ferrugineus TaxID=354439 RepID=A0A834I6L8_RHYFE|nr:hypothetical protein GWI33_014190 [Rhynchophorus ferrugineus]
MSDSNDLKQVIDGILRSVAESQNFDSYEANSDLNVDTGDGFLGQFITGSVKDKTTGEIINVVIKKSPKLAFNNFTFKNEIAFYSIIFPALRSLQTETGVSTKFDHITRYFSGSTDPEKLYVAMEDLRLMDYVMHDKKKYLDQKHLRYIFRLYGRFHALSFVLKKQNHDKFASLVSETVQIFEKMGEGLIKVIEPCVVAGLNGLVSEDAKAVRDKCKELADNLSEHFFRACRYRGDYSCITHGDCWSNNFFFKYSESGQLEDMKLIDFQFCRESTPVHDLSFLFYSGASKDDFDKVEEYLQLYHESFCHYATEFGLNGEDLLPFEILKQDWKQYSLFGALMGIMLWQIKLTDKEQCKEYTEKEGEERSVEHLDSVMGKSHQSSDFKERTGNILIHAVEYGLF